MKVIALLLLAISLHGQPVDVAMELHRQPMKVVKVSEKIIDLPPGYYQCSFGDIGGDFEKNEIELVPAVKNKSGYIGKNLKHSRTFHNDKWNGKMDGSYNWQEIKSHKKYGAIYWTGERWRWETFGPHPGTFVCCIGDKLINP